MLSSRNDSQSELSWSPRALQSTPQRRRAHGQGNQQHASASPYRHGLRCSIGDESPLASENRSLKELTDKELIEELSAYNFEPSPHTFRTSYQTPHHRTLPAFTPLRARRIRMKTHLIQNSDITYGVRRLFKEEIFAIGNHPMCHIQKQAGKDVLDFGS